MCNEKKRQLLKVGMKFSEDRPSTILICYEELGKTGNGLKYSNSSLFCRSFHGSEECYQNI